jgi:excisionase family DNA binding protein
MTARQFLTVREFCDRFAVSRSTYYRLVANGDLAPVHIGRAVRVRATDASNWADSLANDN